MIYQDVVEGRFIARPNRFIAHVEIDGESLVCHVKNTGRCRELLTEGAAVYLERAANPKRKTQYDLIAVRKGDILINMDSQAPNKVFGEWVATGRFWPEIQTVRPEYTYGTSRFDFRIDTAEGTGFVEVKGVTLEDHGVARFPDAPTERGIKHLRELMGAAAAGYRAAVFFVIQMKGVTRFCPNDMTHPAFGAALREAAAAGVDIYAYDCIAAPDSLRIDAPVPVLL